MANPKKSKLVLNNVHNCPISEQITYPIGCVKWVHIEFLNEYYSGAKKSLLYLEKEVRKMEKTGNACMWEYGVAISTLNEMRKALMVGMFHLWLHNLQEFFAFGGNEFHSQKIQFTTSGFDSLIGIFKDLIDQNLIKTIKKYSLLTNVIKHGLGRSWAELKQGYPEFFYPSQEYTKTDEEGNICEDAREPLVTKEHFEELHDTLLEFWEMVPDKISVDIQKLRKVRM